MLCIQNQVAETCHPKKQLMESLKCRWFFRNNSVFVETFGVETTDSSRWETEYERLWARETAALMIQRCTWDCSWTAKVSGDGHFNFHTWYFLAKTIYNSSVCVYITYNILVFSDSVDNMQFNRERRHMDIFGGWCVSMECIEFSLDVKISKVVDAGLRKECPWLACSHRRTALRIKDSRGAEPETGLDAKMFGTNLTFLLTQGLND